MNIERIKEAGATVFGCLIFIAIFAVIGIIIIFGASVASIVMPVMFTISGWVIFFLVVTALPLYAFRRTRAWAANLVLGSSYLFGLTSWIFGFLVTYGLWGFLGVLIGVLLLGIGVVPMAILASLLNQDWSTALWVLSMAVLTLGTRFLGLYMIEKSEEGANNELKTHQYFCSNCGEETSENDDYCTSCGRALIGGYAK